MQKLFHPQISAKIVTGDDAELGGAIDAQIKQLHETQLREIITIESIMHASALEKDASKKVVNFEQNNILAGLLKKLLGQLPLDDDLTPKNYDPIDPNVSVFASKYKRDPLFGGVAQEHNGSMSARSKTPTRLRKSIRDLTSGAKNSTSLLGGKDAEQMKDLWVTHV